MQNVTLEGLLVAGIAVIGYGVNVIQGDLKQGSFLLLAGCALIGYRGILKKYTGE